MVKISFPHVDFHQIDYHSLTRTLQYVRSMLYCIYAQDLEGEIIMLDIEYWIFLCSLICTLNA